MISVFLSASLLLSSVVVTLASYGIEPATVHPSRPTSCFNRETNNFYENGESWQIKGCGVASCVKTQSSGKTSMMISYESCGSVGHEPGCYTEVNNDAEYPDCCPEVVCPSSEDDGDNDNNANLNIKDIQPIAQGSDGANINVRSDAEADQAFTKMAQEWISRLKEKDLEDSMENEIDLDDDFNDGNQNHKNEFFRRKHSSRFFYY